jgi:hypothetical protein
MPGFVICRIQAIYRRHPDALAVLHGEPRRMCHGHSFETPRKRAAPQDEGLLFCAPSFRGVHSAKLNGEPGIQSSAWCWIPGLRPRGRIPE